jgi:aspartate/glutamate racemase
MRQMVEDARAAMPLYDTTSIHAEAAVSLAQPCWSTRTPA